MYTAECKDCLEHWQIASVSVDEIRQEATDHLQKATGCRYITIMKGPGAATPHARLYKTIVGGIVELPMVGEV